MDVAFYRCTREGPVAVLGKLAEKIAATGHRAIVQADDAALREDIDRQLWTADAASFIPHGQAGGDHDADQPILIAPDFSDANGARIAVAMSSRLPGLDAGYERILYIFDAGDEDSLNAARKHWKALSGREDVTPVYWKQVERGWEKQA